MTPTYTKKICYFSEIQLNLSICSFILLYLAMLIEVVDESGSSQKKRSYV